MKQPESELQTDTRVSSPEEQQVICERDENRFSIHFQNLPYLCRANARAVHEDLKQYLNSESEIVMDLGGVINIDAQGLALLIHLNKKLKKINSQLALINVSLGLRKVLNVTEVDRLIRVHDNEDSTALFPAQAGEWSKSHDLRRNIETYKKYK